MFNANAQEMTNENTLLPEGRYQVLVTDLQYKQNQAGTGTFFALSLTVVGPQEHNKRQLYENFTFEHTNADAKRIGRGQLADFIFACKAPPEFRSPDEAYHNVRHRELLVSVKHKKEADSQIRARVETFFGLDGTHRNPVRSLQSSQPAPQPAPAAQSWASQPATQQRKPDVPF